MDLCRIGGAGGARPVLKSTLEELAEGAVLQNNSLQCSPEPVPGLRWNCNEILIASLPFSPRGHGSAFHKVRFRG
jgi:hypothetical protein